MGYRLPEHQHHHHARPRHMADVATPTIVCVDNGAIARMEIPCSYVEWHDHDRMLHDHIGWPEPRHIDRSCQLPAGMEKVEIVNEINLPDEGYTDVDVALPDDAPDGLSVQGIVDYDKVWLTFTVNCDDAVEQDIDVPFTVFACGYGMDFEGNVNMPLRDVVLKGILHIVAGPHNAQVL